MSKTLTLMEAAAEILSGSKSSAPRMELEKSPQGFQDLGGPTPTQSTHSKIDVGAKEATPPGKQPSSGTKAPFEKAAGQAVEIEPEEEGETEDAEANAQKARIEAGLRAGHLKEEDKDEDDDKDGDDDGDDDEDDEKDDEKDEKDEKDLKEAVAQWHAELQEDVAAILASETSLPKEFADKIGTIYEARVSDKVMSIQESIEAEYAEKFEAAVLEVRDNLTEQVNDYLDYVVGQWMEQNELAIEKGLRSELTEEFIGGLRNLFLENFIDVPSEKVDLVDELATKVEELTSELNEEVAKGIELKKQLGESKKSEILNGVCEGLTQTQVEKVRTLAESVEFTAEGDYTKKVSTIRENYFPITTGKPASDSNAKMLTEASEIAEEKSVIIDAGVASVVASLTRSLK